MSEAILETVTALVGTKAIAAAMADLTPGTAVVTGDDIPFYPRLTVRRNAYSLRKLLTPAQQEYFWELLKVCGLRRSGWNVRKLKGDPGAQQLWALATGLMDRPEKLLAIEPMVGMAEADRQSFAALLRWCGEKGVSLSFTSVRLKEVMELGTSLRIRLALPGGWRETDTFQIEEALAGEEEKSWNKLQLRWEEGEDGKASEA